MKDDEDLRIVFVCAMWITGFDVPSCSTIYLDKPTRNHTLMQTIARANRVWRDKQNGLIVDYVGVFRNLQTALAIYGTARTGPSEPGTSPIQDKSALVRQVRDAIATATGFSQQHGIDPAKIRDTRGFDRERLKDDAVAAFVADDGTRRRFLNLAGTVDKIFKSLLPDAAAQEFGPICRVFHVVVEKIRADLPTVDISAVMGDIESLLNRSIAAEGYTMPVSDPARYIDLSQVDFDKLKEQFEEGRKTIEAQRLRARAMVRFVIETELDKLPRAFSKDLYDQKCDRVYQHFFDAYPGTSSNVH